MEATSEKEEEMLVLMIVLLSKEIPSSCQLEPSIMESGEASSERVMEFKRGKTGLGMRATGPWIRLMGLENYSMQMEMCMKGLGSMIKHMEEASTNIRMVQLMKENGKKTNSME
jgi:hypothetical protein